VKALVLQNSSQPKICFKDRELPYDPEGMYIHVGTYFLASPPHILSKPALGLCLLHHASRSLEPPRHLPRPSHTPLRLIPLPVPPHAILARHAEPRRILIPLDALPPLPTQLRTVNQDIDLLGMIPRLRILVPRSLDANMPIRDQQLHVAATRPEVVMDRVVLIFANIIRDVQACALLVRRDCGAEVGGEHLVGAALAGHDLAGVIVA